MAKWKHCAVSIPCVSEMGIDEMGVGDVGFGEMEIRDMGRLHWTRQSVYSEAQGMPEGTNGRAETEKGESVPPTGQSQRSNTNI